MAKECENPILNIIVVGFHHKKGCQVEYSYPPLVDGQPSESNGCPPGWKYLPTLALPDGSHNYDEDAVYFHLPSLTDQKQTIYGISCFRQIPIEKLKARTADMTRGTIQKSVCVLSSLPLYGHIQVKMSLITHAYFEEGDFSKVSLLHDAYHHLNACLRTPNLQHHLHVGLSTRDLILQFRHKVLLLFKLMLLERKVIFFRSPVQPLCAALLSLLSLHPGMLEHGLSQSSYVKPSRPMSPVPDFEDSGESEVDKKQLPDVVPVNSDETASNSVEATPDDPPSESLDNKSSSDISRETSSDNITESALMIANLSIVAQMKPEECGLPLAVFTNGTLCHPYLSLPFLDLIADKSVRGFVIGATNVLFKQKRHLADVLVDMEAGTIETHDPQLRRQLHLSTEDLRFAEHIVRHVTEERHDVFLDGVGWEGGDEWIRSQFALYLLCLLRTSLLQDGSREMEHFNSSFMSSWKLTHNYRQWSSNEHPGIWDLNPGHPFAGQLSVSDMKLRLSHTMQNTEGGRKINQAMASTGRAVATTGRAVGGAISQAKGAFSTWWSTLTTPTDVASEVASEVIADEKSTDLEDDTEQGDEVTETMINTLSSSEKNNTDCPKEMVEEKLKENEIISNLNIIQVSKQETSEG